VYGAGSFLPEQEKTVFGVPADVDGLPRRRAVFKIPEALVNR
jgi:hypothetical protein